MFITKKKFFAERIKIRFSRTVEQAPLNNFCENISKIYRDFSSHHQNKILPVISRVLKI